MVMNLPMFGMTIITPDDQILETKLYFWGVEYSKGKNHANPFAGASMAFISIMVDPALEKASAFLMASHRLSVVSHLWWFIRSWIYHESDW